MPVVFFLSVGCPGETYSDFYSAETYSGFQVEIQSLNRAVGIG